MDLHEKARGRVGKRPTRPTEYLALVALHIDEHEIWRAVLVDKAIDSYRRHVDISCRAALVDSAIQSLCERYGALGRRTGSVHDRQILCTVESLILTPDSRVVRLGLDCKDMTSLAHLARENERNDRLVCAKIEDPRSRNQYVTVAQERCDAHLWPVAIVPALGERVGQHDVERMSRICVGDAVRRVVRDQRRYLPLSVSPVHRVWHYASRYGFSGGEEHPPSSLREFGHAVNLSHSAGREAAFRFARFTATGAATVLAGSRHGFEPSEIR